MEDNVVLAQDRGKEDRVGYVSTLSLIMYMVTFLAWEAELGVILVHVFARQKLDPLGHAVLLAFWGSLTMVTCLRGKHDLHKLAQMRGRIPLTFIQGVIITLSMVACGGVFAFIVIRITEH